MFLYILFTYFRMSICFLVAFPLGASMIVAGGFSVNACTNPSVNLTTTDVVQATDSFVINDDIGAKNVSDDFLSIESETQTEMVHIPVWLLVAGCAVLLVLPVYYIYDVYCKEDQVTISPTSFSMQMFHKVIPF